jgi:hypothetical protein
MLLRFIPCYLIKITKINDFYFPTYFLKPELGVKLCISHTSIRLKDFDVRKSQYGQQNIHILEKILIDASKLI